MISFVVRGNPIPKQSFRVGNKNGKVSGYTDPKGKAWQDAISWKAKEAMAGNAPLEGRVQVYIQFWRDSRRKVDLDNLSKAVLDACNKIVWRDDKQIWKLELEKGYDKEKPGIWISVENYQE